MTLFDILIFMSGFMLFAILISVGYGIHAERKSSQKLKELNQKGFKVVNDLRKQTKESDINTLPPVMDRSLVPGETRRHTFTEETSRHRVTEETPAHIQRKQHKNIFEPQNTAPDKQKKTRQNYRDLWR